MGQLDRGPSHMRRVFARLGAVVALLVAVALFVASSALAAYEQVGTFAGSAAPVLEEKFSEEVQLGGVGGMAVNYTGAGGVPAGTVYAVTKDKGGSDHVVMFEPGAGGGLTFRESWFVNHKEEAYERCGPTGELPDGELVHPNCNPNAGTGTEASSTDVEVDQTTGNVYVLLEIGNYPVGTRGIIEYKPDGSKVITRFGELAASGETVATSQDKIHLIQYPGGMAVDGTGDVYVYDETQIPSFYHRLMVFKPQSPSDYEHYVYAGETVTGTTGDEPPFEPVTDAAGNIYVGGGTLNYVAEYGPETPAPYPAPKSHPICRFVYAPGGIESLTVDPVSGEVFFYSFKSPKRVRRLGPCNPVTHEFTELTPEPEALTVTPERGLLTALAFDPVRKLSPTREAGVLYGGAPSPVPDQGKGEPHQSSLGYIFARVEKNPPVVSAESVSGVTKSSAVLHAMIDPRGFRTHYVFQYMTEAAFVEGGESFTGATEMPVGGGSVDPAKGVQSVAVSVSGLDPETAYRYRVVASSGCAPKEPSKVCEGTGTAQSFDTFPVEASGLPDGRAYELVSPIDKNGGEVFPADPTIGSCGENCKSGFYGVFPVQDAPDGEAVVYEGSAFSGSEGGGSVNEYVSRRTQSGWQTTNLTPPILSIHTGGGYAAFNAELSQGIVSWAASALSPEAPAEYHNLYTQSGTDPSVLTPLVRSEPPDRPASGTGSFTIDYAGASADGSRVFFAANDALSEASAFAPAAVDGGPSENNLYEWSGGRLRLVNVKPGNTETETGAAFGDGSANAISTDGSRVFWSSPAGQVYVREDGERTREIPDHTGKFLSASTDGSRVLLNDGDLYDLENETTIDLTNGEGGFQGLVGQSEGLSHVYFVDTAVLDETPNEHGETAKPGQDNLYAWHEGSSPRFVATLRAQDNTGNEDQIGRDWIASPSERTAQASPDGGWLAFISTAQLTGYDNTGPCVRIIKEKGGGGEYESIPRPCPEVFLYNTATNGLVCASCNRSGTSPLGWSALRVLNKRPQPHYLSDQGRLFFDSEDSLVPADVNNGVEDVYEYEPGGVGTCTRGDGCVALISAGTGTTDSNFLAADSSGKNVFFTTRDRLVGSDKDELVDLYDAREGGGFPSEAESRPGECAGEACSSPPSTAPVEPVPGSFAFSGTGNILTSPIPAVTEPKAKPKTLTRAQRLAKALAACKKRPSKQRTSCERQARKQYGAKASAKRSIAGNSKGER